MSSKRDCNGLKHCVECFRALCESSFSKRSDAKDGLQAVCKECQRTLKKNWIVANYDHVVESNRQWNQSHPQIALNRVNRWKSDNPYKARLNSQKTAQTRRARKKAAFVESITPIRLGLSEVLGELGRLGYRVRAGIFSASEVGAPHRRERVFILAYSDSIRSEWIKACTIQTGRQQSTVSRRGSLAHSIREGQGHAGDGARCLRQERKVSESDRSVSKDGLLWPSRPGEPQHEWEEPRTIDRKLNPSWVAQLMGLPSDWVEVPGLTREMKLRSLGNGVVPQQAELAIRTLYNDP
jgi:site-specific DNA-cytosine methylase